MTSPSILAVKMVRPVGKKPFKHHKTISFWYYFTFGPFDALIFNKLIRIRGLTQFESEFGCWKMATLCFSGSVFFRLDPKLLSSSYLLTGAGGGEGWSPGSRLPNVSTAHGASNQARVLIFSVFLPRNVYTRCKCPLEFISVSIYLWLKYSSIKLLSI